MTGTNRSNNCGNIVIAGPPGLGKTMIAVGIGLVAINSGYTVCFDWMNWLVPAIMAAEQCSSNSHRS